MFAMLRSSLIIMNESNICENCKYFTRHYTESMGMFGPKKRTMLDYGHCWRFPPMIVMGYHSITIGDSKHPTVKLNDFCGEFKPK